MAFGCDDISFLGFGARIRPINFSAILYDEIGRGFEFRGLAHDSRPPLITAFIAGETKDSLRCEKCATPPRGNAANSCIILEANGLLLTILFDQARIPRSELLLSRVDPASAVSEIRGMFFRKFVRSVPLKSAAVPPAAW